MHASPNVFAAEGIKKTKPLGGGGSRVQTSLFIYMKSAIFRSDVVEVEIVGR